MSNHIQKLINMYMSAPIQQKYPGIHLEIEPLSAKITLPIDESYHHAGGYLHGSVYFRLLDDVTYFAAMSNEEKYFYVTKSFDMQFYRPFKTGLVTAVCDDVKWLDDEFHATGFLLNQDGKKIAAGTGIFSKSQQELRPEIGYKDNL